MVMQTWRLVVILAVLAAIGSGGVVVAEQPRRPSGRVVHDGFPYNLVSADRLLADLEELTAIRAHGGWRCCGSRGEAEARQWVAAQLAEMSFLTGDWSMPM